MFDPGGVGEWSPPPSPRVHPRSRAEGALGDLGGRKEKVNHHLCKDWTLLIAEDPLSGCYPYNLYLGAIKDASSSRALKGDSLQLLFRQGATGNDAIHLDRIGASRDCYDVQGYSFLKRRRI